MKKNLKGLKILVTAGPTREYFDPVRFLSNPSSGKMGYALAQVASQKGARVTLISGPTSLPPPKISKFVRVTSAEEMRRAVRKETSSSDLVIMAAAVSDYRPQSVSSKKIKKKAKKLRITLLPTRDILKELGKRKRRGQILVGFAAETDHLLRNALKKMREKNLDFIVANRIGPRNVGFESDKNRAVIFSAKGGKTVLSLMPKKRLADKILGIIADR